MSPTSVLRPSHPCLPIERDGHFLTGKARQQRLWPPLFDFLFRGQIEGSYDTQTTKQHLTSHATYNAPCGLFSMTGRRVLSRFRHGTRACHGRAFKLFSDVPPVFSSRLLPEAFSGCCREPVFHWLRIPIRPSRGFNRGVRHHLANTGVRPFAVIF